MHQLDEFLAIYFGEVKDPASDWGRQVRAINYELPEKSAKRLVEVGYKV